jgi:hypothetical protein
LGSAEDGFFFAKASEERMEDGADLTAKNAEIAKKKHLFVLFAFFVVTEFFMGLRIGGGSQ